MQAHQGLAQCGLTAAGLSDDTDGLALLDVEGDIIYCMQKSSRSLEVLLQILRPLGVWKYFFRFFTSSKFLESMISPPIPSYTADILHNVPAQLPC